METEELNNSPERTKRVPLWLLILIPGLVIVGFSWTAINSFHRITHFNRAHQESDSLLQNMVTNDRSADSVFLANLYLKVRFGLMKEDSIYIVINLSDSSISLELGGVKLHRVTIHAFRHNLPEDMRSVGLRSYLFGLPHTINSYHASVPKIPIVIKYAPRDTAEANRMKDPPAAPADRYTVYSLHTDRHVSITIKQVEKAPMRDLLLILRYNFSARLKSLWQLLKMKNHGDPFIHLHLNIPKSDALTIFRALPEKAKVAIKIE